MTRGAQPPKVDVIVVMGNTGVGKSTFIQYATGENVTIGHSLESCKSMLGHRTRVRGAPFLTYECSLL